MGSVRQTPTQIASALYALMPRALSPALLQEYGIEVTQAQARHITREVLSLTLFWIQSALETLTEKHARLLVIESLAAKVREAWTTDFQFGAEELAGYFIELEDRQGCYMRIVQEGGNHVAVFHEALWLLENEAALSREYGTKMLSCLIDQVSVDAFGDLLEDLEVVPG